MFTRILIPTLIGLCIGLTVLLIQKHNLFNSVEITSFNSFQPSSESIVQPSTQVKPSIENPFRRTSFADAVEAASPAVVNIYASRTVKRNTHPLLSDPKFQQFLGRFTLPQQEEKMQNSLGSGVFIGEDGYLLTNRHVIQGAEQIAVALSDGRKSPAKVIGTDPVTDLAVLKVDLVNLPQIPLPLASNALRVGDIVLAIGNPFGFNQSVSIGIISALGRSNLGITTYENFIQTDAAINPGNSGGALINAQGELIGINTAVFNKGGQAQGIGFAIPVEVALLVMSDLVEFGRVNRGWLGIETIDLTPALAARFDIPYHTGILITKIFKDSPAHKSGLLPGDIITRINGATTSSFLSASKQVAMVRPKDEVEIHMVRMSNPLKATLTASEHPNLR
jgi:serine protease DegS